MLFPVDAVIVRETPHAKFAQASDGAEYALENKGLNSAGNTLVGAVGVLEWNSALHRVYFVENKDWNEVSKLVNSKNETIVNKEKEVNY